MTALLDVPTRVSPLLETASPLPVIAREGIRWTGGAGGRPLVVSLDFENPSDRPTRPTTARLEIADFGAFRPWRGLTTIRNPRLAPGGRTTVSAMIQDAQRFVQFRTRVESGRETHFVGNINVFVDSTNPVERHLRRTIGLRPGAVNTSAFFVGNGMPETYRFRIEGCESGWGVTLDRPTDRAIEIDSAIVGLAIVPPSKAEAGRIAIGVDQLSTGSTALVEFELETSRLGSKCYHL